PATPAGTQRFDFNLGGSPNTSGFTSVQPGNTYTTTFGFGWLNAASGYDRGAAPGAAPTQVPLYQDGHWGMGADTFQVFVGTGGARQVRVYVGDPYKPWPNLSVSIEGGPTVPVAYTTAGQYG